MTTYKQLGGQATYGYKWEGKLFTIDEKEAPVRKLMYEVFLKHKRKKAVARELNNMGYRTRNGSNFSDTTIDRLLRDTTPKGERIANFTKGAKRTLKPESEWVRLQCPAIVSSDIWNECNRILNEQKQKRKRVRPAPVHLLAGYVFCDCGKKMYTHHANEVYRCSACKKRSISAQDLDEIYHSQLKSFLLTEVDVAEYLKQNDSFIREKESLLQLLTNESGKLRKEMNELVQMRVQREMTPENFAMHYKPKEDRLTQIDNQMPELQAEVDFLKIQYLSSDMVLREAKDLYDRWLTLTFEEKRTIVEIITDRITIGENDIAFSLAYLPASLNVGKRQCDY